MENIIVCGPPEAIWSAPPSCLYMKYFASLSDKIHGRIIPRTCDSRVACYFQLSFRVFSQLTERPSKACWQHRGAPTTVRPVATRLVAGNVDGPCAIHTPSRKALRAETQSHGCENRLTALDHLPITWHDVGCTSPLFASHQDGTLHSAKLRTVPRLHCTVAFLTETSADIDCQTINSAQHKPAIQRHSDEFLETAQNHCLWQIKCVGQPN